jgi:hypothetical protein
MSHPKRPAIDEKDLVGFKYFRKINHLLARLHEAGCARDRAGNRRLHMDQYMALLLLFMFNPICDSLRSLQRASQLKKVQRVLGVPRTSLGSLSEAVGVFDPSLLEGLLGELVAELKPLPHDPRLGQVQGLLTLVDGTYLTALPALAHWALWQENKRHCHAAKAHVQFEVLKGVPVAAALTDAHASEIDVLAARLQPGRLYVLDRGYARYAFLQAILDAGSSFVCRLDDNAVIEVVEERPLSEAARAAGVVRDALVRVGCAARRNALRQPIRLVEVACRPHRRPSGKNGRGGPEQGTVLRLGTDILDLPPEVISLIYQARWQIEIFFRMFKHLLGCRHLLSYSEDGLRLQTYAAILACLLIALWTGRRPTLATYEMLAWYFSGWADDEELQAHLDGLKAQPPLA